MTILFIATLSLMALGLVLVAYGTLAKNKEGINPDSFLPTLQDHASSNAKTTVPSSINVGRLSETRMVISANAD